MFLQSVAKGATVAIAVMGQVASIGLDVIQNSEAKTDVMKHLKQIKVSAEIISTNSRDNIVLFRDQRLFDVLALVNQGSAFIQEYTDASTPAKYHIKCNVPLCFDGALQSDKTKYVSFKIDMTDEALSVGSTIDAYMLGSVAVGTEPLRIVENRFRPKESTHLSLTGCDVLMYEHGMIDRARYKSVTGMQTELTDPEYDFYTNVLADIFVMPQDENGTARTIPGYNLMPTTTFVDVEIEAGDLNSIPVYLLYKRYSNSQIPGCNC